MLNLRNNGYLDQKSKSLEATSPPLCTVLKRNYEQMPPKITYRSYKNFKDEQFKEAIISIQRLFEMQWKKGSINLLLLKRSFYVEMINPTGHPH